MRGEHRELILKMGPPLYVPAESVFEDWRIGGWHGADESGGALAVTVTCFDPPRRRTLHIETSVEEAQPDEWLIGQVLLSSVPFDVKLPFTLTVTERIVSVQTPPEYQEFRLIEAGDKFWLATAQIQGRRITVKGAGFVAEDLVLERVSDLEALPDRHWGPSI